MANEFIARKGLIARASSQVTGSLDVSNFLRSVSQKWFSGTSPTSSLYVSGNLQMTGGESSYTHTFPAATTTLVGTDVTQTLTNKTVSGSFSGSGTNIFGVDYDNLVNVPGGIISSSGQFTTGDDVTFGVITGSALHLLTSTLEASESLDIKTGIGQTLDLSIQGASSQFKVSDDLTGDLLQYTRGSAVWQMYASLRFANNKLIYVRNSANTADMEFVYGDNNDNMYIGRDADINFIGLGHSTVPIYVNSDVEMSGSLIVAEKITAQEVWTQYITSSIGYISGSTRFGGHPAASTTHEFTGSVDVSGSLSVGGTFSGSGANIFGVVSSSYAETSSYVDTVVSSSYAVSASYAANGGSQGGGITWTVITSEQTASTDNGYIMNNASQLKLHLPATSATGKVVRLAGLGTGGWRLAQGAGQRIHFGNISSSLGTGGYIESTHFRDAVELVCVVADDEWQVISAVGSIEVT